MMGRLWNLFLGRDLPRAAAVLRGHAAAVLPLDVLMLEDRILFSASAPDGGAPDADADSSHWDGDDGNADWNDFNDDASIEFLTDPDPLLGEPQDALARELVVIDPRVDHYEQLLNDLLEQQRNGRELAIVVLNSDQDGVEQLSRVLDEYDGLTALHVFSHGSEGSIQLGSTYLDVQSVEEYANLIADWQDALGPEADILLYGCDVAGSPEGRGLLDTIAALTERDVAASTDATGHALLGGDWVLEHQIGEVTASSAASDVLQQSWWITLAAPEADADPMNYTDVIDSLNPISHWRLGDAGTPTAADSGAIDNDGTHAFTTPGAEGAINGSSDGSAYFDGSNDYVAIAHSNAYLLDQGAVQLWFNAESVGTYQGLFSKDHNGLGTGGHLTIYLEADGTLRVRLQSTTDQYFVQTSGAVSAGEWHHVVFTFGPDQMNLYLDGQLVDTEAYTGGLGTTSGGSGNAEPIAIGASTRISDPGSITPLSGFFTGMIDEVAIFGSQLDAETVQDLYASALQYYTVAENGVLTVSAREGVLANDFDPDGDSLTAQLVNDVSFGTLELNPDGSFTYTPDAEFSGTDTFTYRASDGTNQTEEVIVTLTVEGNNDAPSNSVPGEQSVSEDSQLVFQTANGNAISVSDPDVGQGELEVALSVDHGVLTLASTDGLSFSSGTNGSSTMTFTGSVDDINNALDGLSYTPDTDYSGNDTLTMTTSDQGSAGSGGPQTDVDTVALTVNPVNDAPVASVPPPQNTSEEEPLVFSTANGNAISIADLDAAGGALEVTLSVANGMLTLGTTNNLTFTGGGNGTSSMSFTGTVDAINAALEGLTYTPANDFDEADTLTLLVNDQGNTGSGGPAEDSASIDINVDPVNDAPEITTPAPQQTDENTALVFSTANGNAVSVSDPDSGAGELQVTLSVANGILSLATTSGITFVAGGDGEASMTIRGTADAINTALDGLTYTPDAGYFGDDGLSIAVDDQGNTGAGGPLSDSDSVGIIVASVNDAPVIAAPGPQSVDEDSVLTFSSAGGNGITLSDVDAGAGSLELTISVAEGTITLGSTTGLTFTEGSNGSASMTVVGSLVDLNAALDGLSYAPGADFAGTDALTILLNDQGNTGSGGPAEDFAAVEINVNASNDAPEIIVPEPQQTSEDGDLVFSAANGNAISVSDPDSGAGELQVTLSVANGILSLATTSGITFVAGGDGEASMTIRGTADAINAAMDGLVYTPNADYSGDDSLAIAVNDQGNSGAGGPLGDSDSVAITVASVNDPPVVTVPGAQSVDEDSVLVFSIAGGNGIEVNDIDLEGGQLEVTLTVLQGRLTLASTSGLNFIAGSNGSDSMTIQGTASDINAALDGLEYRGDAEFHGQVTLTVTVNDLGNSGAGGPASDGQTIDISVNSVNDAPVGQSDTYSTSSVEALTVDVPGVLLNDLDPEGDPLKALLVEGPKHGELVLNEDGRFVYTPGAGFHGTDSFTYVANDGDLSSEPITVVIVVEPVGPGASSPPDGDGESQDSDEEESDSEELVAGPLPVIERPEVQAVNARPRPSTSRSSGGGPQVVRMNPVHIPPVTIDDTDVRVAEIEDLIRFTARHLADAAFGRDHSTSNPSGSVDYRLLGQNLDRLAQEMESQSYVNRLVIGSATVSSGALSVGYVLWTLRGGSLMASLLSSMPVWRFFDPLPVVASTPREDGKRGDDESLAEMVRRKRQEPPGPRPSKDLDPSRRK